MNLKIIRLFFFKKKTLKKTLRGKYKRSTQKDCIFMKDIHYSKIYTVFVTMRGLWGSNLFSDEYPATAEFAKTGAEQPEQLEQPSSDKNKYGFL